MERWNAGSSCMCGRGGVCARDAFQRSIVPRRERGRQGLHLCRNAGWNGRNAGRQVERKSLNSALEVWAEGRVAEALPLQHELLDLPSPPSAEAARERRAGRPRGARNKRIEDVARAVVEHLGDPLVHLVAIATAPVDELVAQGLTVQEALVEKRLAAIGALPYTHQRQAQRVDVTNHKVVTITFVESERDQGVIDAAVAQSDDWRSDGEGNPLIALAEGDGGQLIADQPAADPEGGPPPPGGPLFGPSPPPRAPAGVLNPPGRIFDANSGISPAGEGAGP